ncbi:MAG: acyl-CoA dehydrogenase family protein [Proteobacteria bacterium]|nr:acyl-CoA dehydrogenase family protein [Pseudomonadota bacterium]
MDFRFTPEEEAFRSEVQEFLKQELKPGWEDAFDAESELGVEAHGEFARNFNKKLSERGWLAIAWPEEYGGKNASVMQQVVYNEEMAYAGAPVGFNMGVAWVGPSLMLYGTDEQKQEFIPKITNLEHTWCTLYSEPAAGSDLAAIQTKAVRDGDDFIINGTKVWTSYADQADWIFALVRDSNEGKKQEGITFLLIDMETPGVSVSPILLISGKSPFCETHFQDVRVPIRNVIGKIGSGWTVAKALLGHERSMISDTFGAGGAKDRGKGSRLVALAREYVGETDGGRVSDPVVRDRIAEAEMETRAFGLTVQRSRDAAKAGHQPGPESSLFKVYATELNKRRHELMVQLLGPQALGWEGEGFDDDELALTRDWLRSRGNSIEGGTSEIQLNIIAKRVLGLPD